MRSIKILLGVVVVALLAAAAIFLAGGQGGQGNTSIVVNLTPDTSIVVYPTPATSINVNLTPYKDNPVLAAGKAGEWDSGGIACQSLVYDSGVFHLFYVGYAEDVIGSPLQVGYATSKEGMVWTKSEKNPIAVADKTIAPNGVACLSVMLDEKNWVMYFTPSETADRLGDGIYRATAPAPTGPWTINPQPVLKPGKPLVDWDGAFSGKSLVPGTVLRSDEGYVLYYVPADVVPSVSHNPWPWNTSSGFGRATSPDGITWTKYNDPDTTDRENTVSDPVFLTLVDSSAWDSSYLLNPLVRHSEDGWEMFYGGNAGVGSTQTGYAVSKDGIHWTRVGNKPIFSIENGFGRPGGVVMINNTVYLLNSVRLKGSAKIEVWLFTGTIMRQ